MAGFAMVLGVSVTGPAHAQFNPFYATNNQPALTGEDFRLLDESAAKLNTDPKLRTGQVERWNNPASGASGTVTVTRIFSSQGMTCHLLRYGIVARSRSGESKYDLTWCRPPGQDWKIKS